MSDPLEGFEVMGVSSWSLMGEAVMAFAESGNECMGRRFDSRDEAQRHYQSARKYIKYHKLKSVKAIIRDDVVLLAKVG